MELQEYKFWSTTSLNSQINFIFEHINKVENLNGSHFRDFVKLTRNYNSISRFSTINKAIS